MITAIENQKLSSLQPERLSKYLGSTGWKIGKSWSKNADLWLKEYREGRSYEVLVPHDIELTDYADVIIDSVKTISISENRDVSGVISDLFYIDSDITKIRSNSPSTSDGTILFDDLIGLVDNTKVMLMSAARATLQPQGFYRTNIPSKVRNYMDALRFGQTARGSFVLSIIAKHTMPQEDISLIRLGINIDPFERQVLRKLNSALLQIDKLTEQSVNLDDDKVLFDVISTGVSANLCQAIVEMQNSTHGGKLELSFDWGKNSPAPQEAQKTIVFEPKQVQVIADTAKILKTNVFEREVALRGAVIGLQRAEGEETGKVTIASIYDGKSRTVRFTLRLPDYLKAVKAHEESLAVSVRGSLTKLNNTYYYQSVSGFRVEEPDLF